MVNIRRITHKQHKAIGGGVWGGGGGEGAREGDGRI